MSTISCSFCSNSDDIFSSMRCTRGHALCSSCSQEGYFFLQTERTNCPGCGSKLVKASQYTPPPGVVDQVLKDLKKQSWKFQLWWLRYNLRNPDLPGAVVFWVIALIVLGGASPTPGFLGVIFCWLLRTAVISAALMLSYGFIKRKRSKLNLVSGWKAVVGGDKKAILITSACAAAASLVFTIKQSISK